MSSSNSTAPPPLRLEGGGRINTSGLADVIQWFLDHDRRVGVIRHPKVEELFHWKQEQARGSGEDVYHFEHAEDRLAIGVMQAAGGRLVSKVGAEGVYAAGVLPCAEWPRGLGLALKIEDGEDRRARPTVVIESLRQLGALDPAALEALEPYSSFPIRNHRGDHVGEVRANFELELLA